MLSTLDPPNFVLSGELSILESNNPRNNCDRCHCKDNLRGHGTFMRDLFGCGVTVRLNNLLPLSTS